MFSRHLLFFYYLVDQSWSYCSHLVSTFSHLVVSKNQNMNWYAHKTIIVNGVLCLNLVNIFHILSCRAVEIPVTVRKLFDFVLGPWLLSMSPCCSKPYCENYVYSRLLKYASVGIQEKMHTFKKYFMPFLNLRET